MEIDVNSYKEIVENLVRYMVLLKGKAVEEKLDFIWQQLGLQGMMPAELKREFFKTYYDKNVKIGDRHED